MISIFQNTMSDVYDPPDRVSNESHCRGMLKYQEMYQESIDDPKKFWKRICDQFYWKKSPPEGMRILFILISFSRIVLCAVL